MNRMHTFTAILILLCIFSTRNALGDQAPDHMKVVVPKSHVSYNESMGGPIGAFVYSKTDNRFYVSTYGSNRGIRCYVGSDDSFPAWESQEWPVLNKISDSWGKSWQCATESTLARVAGSLDMAAGLFNSNYTASTLISGMIINPEPVIVNGTFYDTGKLAIISDNSRALLSNATKRLVAWDLREVWSPTGLDPNSVDPNEFAPSSPVYNPLNLPDRANAQYDAGQLMVHVFGSKYGYGCTNWNDAFSYVLTLQDMADAIDAGTVAVTTADNMAGRRAAFSSDGQKVYYVCKDSRSFGSRLFSGLWSTNIETGVTKRLFDDTGDNGETVSNRKAVTCSEPGVLSVGVRNLTGLSYDPSYDQLLFNGTEVGGNLSGLNCIVDDGTDNPAIHIAISGTDILDFIEVDVNDPAFYGIDDQDSSTWPDDYDLSNPDPATYVDIGDWPKIWSVTTDSVGNIYFYMRTTYSLFMYDTKNRMIALKNRPQHLLFNKSLGSTSANTENLRLQIRNIEAPYDENQMIPQIMYMSTAGKCIAGVDIYKSCDFNRDGQITISDLDFFGRQLRKSSDPNTVPDFDDSDCLDYLKADLNGSGKYNPDKTGLIKASVTQKDAEVLYQFIIPGNANLDEVVDMQDFAILAANYQAEDPNGWAYGDFDFDLDVDEDDLHLLISNWLEKDD